VVQGEEVWPLGGILAIVKTVSIGWLLFSMNTMDPLLLKQQIMEHIQDIPVGLHWKMISMGTQGQVKEEDQV